MLIHAGDPVDRGKASITAEQLTAAQQAVQRAIRGLSHDASKPKARDMRHRQRHADLLARIFDTEAAVLGPVLMVLIIAFLQGRIAAERSCMSSS